MSKIRIAIIKFGGLSVGGSERFLQVIAANLSSNLFQIDYYYCDAAPYLGSNSRHGDTDIDRLQYMQRHNVNLIKFNVAFRDLTKPTFDWINTNFWDLFSENSYDLALTVKSGHPEYPFNLLKIPIVEIVGLPAGIDSRPILHIHPSQYQRKIWFKMGGNLKNSCVIPPPPTPPCSTESLRIELNIGSSAVVAGFHQRADDAIFSPIPLQAFACSFAPERHFIILGGGEKYRNQAKELNLLNVHFLPQTGNAILVSKFLNTLDIFAHGRADGETYGAVIAEAMTHGKPCLSHAVLNGDNAQPETIGPSGWFAANAEEYAAKLEQLYLSAPLRKSLSEKSISHAEEYFSLKSCMHELTRHFYKICGKPEPFSTKPKIPYGISALNFLYAGNLDQPDEIAHHVLTGDIPEEFFTEIVKFFLPEVRTFLDIGTNTGLYCFLAAKNSPIKTKVHCFEPQLERCKVLKKTIYLNNWEQKVFVHHTELNGSITKHLQSSGITNIDFMRIDAENIQREVFDAVIEILSTNRPVLFIQTSKTQYASCSEPIRWLISKQYTVYSCKEKKGRWHHFGSIVKTRVSCLKKTSAYLCLPNEQASSSFVQLKKHLSVVNKNLIKHQINSSRENLIRLVKEVLKKTRFYPIFYRGRNVVSRYWKNNFGIKSCPLT